MEGKNENLGSRNISGKRTTVTTLTLTATFIALVFLLTYPFSSLFPVPSTQGYYDPGDIMIFIGALTFGPVVGGISGGIGSALSDVLGGFGTFAPFTLMIKGFEGYLVGVIAGGNLTRRYLLIAWIAGGLILIGGYFLSETYFIAWLFGSSPYTGVVAASSELPINILQAVGAGLVGIPASFILRSAQKTSTLHPKLLGSRGSSKPGKD